MTQEYKVMNGLEIDQIRYCTILFLTCIFYFFNSSFTTVGTVVKLSNSGLDVVRLVNKTFDIVSSQAVDMIAQRGCYGVGGISL